MVSDANASDNPLLQRYVFGIFELTVFLVSPFFGKYLPLIGLRRGFCGGIATTGLMCVAFGFLEHIDHGVSFITLSLVLRVVEACGNAAFLAASFTVVALKGVCTIHMM